MMIMQQPTLSTRAHGPADIVDSSHMHPPDPACPTNEHSARRIPRGGIGQTIMTTTPAE